MTNATHPADTPCRPAYWGAVLSMSLCVAMLLASEFMPVSLLTPMAEGLGASAGQVGQAVSISGLFAVATSLAITTIAGRLNRKWVMVTLTTIMLLSLVLIAAAQSFFMLMLARALLGIAIGGFWALATAVIMRLVPSAEVPRALALMYGGQAMASAFAAPFGSYLGGLVGWRGVFWVLAPVVAANLLWHLAALPSMPAGKQQDVRTLLRIVRRPYFLRGLVGVMFTFASAFTMFTYLRPFLEQVTGVGVNLLSILLLILGSAGFLGTWGSSRFIGGRAARLLFVPPLIMSACSLLLLLVGGSVVATALVLALWGAMNTAMSVIWMSWLSQNVADAPEAAGSLLVAAIQASILLGALIGGALLDGVSISATFLGSVGLGIIALFMISTGRKLTRPMQHSDVS